MEKKLNKEELIAALAVERKEKVDLQSDDIDKRRALSWMLGAPAKQPQTWGNDPDRITYTWPQIYFEVGKLAAAHTFMDFEGNISELEMAVEKLQRKPNA